MNPVLFKEVCDDAEPVLDNYPSRCGLQPQFLQRLDPTVYATEWHRGPIQQALIERYINDGFVVLEDVFSADEVACLQEELQRIRQGADREPLPGRFDEQEDNTLRSVFAIHRSNTLFGRLAADRRLAGLARFLLDDEVYIHQSRLNYKPAFRGKEFYWHSDFETWHVEDGMPRMRALSMSVALTENHACNGPLMFVPGSHRRYVVCEGETPEGHFRHSLRQQVIGTPGDALLAEMVAERDIVTVDARPGSVIVFDCNVMHGSASNITPYARSNAFFVYNAISNSVMSPFCGREPRPEYVCTRESIALIDICCGKIGSRM